jgi:hypothetical protein
MKKPFMTYYEHLAKLACIANKKTLFLAHLLSRMDFNEETKIQYVDLTANVKRDILKAIGAKSVNPLVLAQQYIKELQKAGLIKSMGGGRYMIDPLSYGYAKYVSKELRERAANIYVKHVFSQDNEGFTETFVQDEYGEVTKL